MTWALWVGRAVEMRALGRCLVCAGVVVRLDADGSHVAVAYGGHEGQVDLAAVFSAARAALADWPYQVDRLEVIETASPRGSLTAAESSLFAQEAMDRAQERRHRRGLRPSGTTPPERN